MKFILTLFAALSFSLASSAQTTQPPVVIYNPNADAAKDIKIAVSKAKKEKKHVFIQVGMVHSLS
ncbi:MAG: hypothetical protein ACQUHE_00275 [Bacteroidia bacterium]